ncbi:MAG: acetate--CoA ligase family protein [Candidatus Latescibacteria bacterium]|nr:acetate--CoA ligase family protein [Candidatus Latescibacterota bacterium]
MRLHEHEAADVFETMGIPVPQRGVTESVDGALKIAEEIGYPVIVKAQVLVGGRGLAGGIKAAANPEELRRVTDILIGSNIKGITIHKVLISSKEDIQDELYIGITIDGYSGKPVVVVSTEGGVSIEETARRHPEKIASFHVDIQSEFLPYQARKLLQKVLIPQRLINPCADVVVRLYNTFIQNDALIAEINPLAVLKNGSLMAVDAVLEIDDSALFRSGRIVPRDPERIDNPLERRGKEIGVTYVDLDGDIGIIASGAGLGMATMDIIGKRLRPANFLETGGGITEDLLYDSMDLVMRKKGLRGIIINVYGGINPIHEGARGVVRYMKEHNMTIPVVAKALGNHQEETWEILKQGGVHVITDVPTEKAVERLFELVGI